jgi:hypothetical protein
MGAVSLPKCARLCPAGRGALKKKSRGAAKKKRTKATGPHNSAKKSIHTKSASAGKKKHRIKKYQRFGEFYFGVQKWVFCPNPVVVKSNALGVNPPPSGCSTALRYSAFS